MLLIAHKGKSENRLSRKKGILPICEPIKDLSNLKWFFPFFSYTLNPKMKNSSSTLKFIKLIFTRSKKNLSGIYCEKVARKILINNSFFPWPKVFYCHFLRLNQLLMKNNETFQLRKQQKKHRGRKDKKGKKQNRKKKKKSYDLLINLGASFSPSLGMFSFFYSSASLFFHSGPSSLSPDCVPRVNFLHFSLPFWGRRGSARSERLRLLFLMSNCFQFFLFRWVFLLARFLRSSNRPQQQRQQRCKDVVRQGRKLIFLSASLLSTRFTNTFPVSTKWLYVTFSFIPTSD